MSNDDNDNIDPMLMGEQPSRARSTPAKPVVDETWTQVEELPEDHDSDFTDEEVSKTITSEPTCLSVLTPNRIPYCRSNT